MKFKVEKKETLTAVVAAIGLLSIPALVVRDRIKNIRAEEEEKRIIKKLIKNTVNLEENLTNEKVTEYIEFVRQIKIPNKVMCKNIARDGYDMVKASENIEDNLKSNLRTILECKGVRELY
ncbi:transcription factor [Clostridium ganghwense]|uniref:Transcription factor n=1 Tax=Clostridium ganghwense TaxID=312089 RepID=A0ABT4CJ65_9CLOT|nr:transcription factor [Clostridium ganghwense]MCY6369095.1 transcription factor [Clostridium ganghwense]